MDHFVFAIRSVDERTSRLCYQLLIKQGIPATSIYVAANLDFVCAIERCFQFSLDKRASVLICLDADVLPISNLTFVVSRWLARLPDQWFEIQGTIVDRLFCGPRTGGIHIYNCQLLPLALQTLKANTFALRPEGSLIRYMNSHGYPNFEVSSLIGIHDFYQSYSDLYRKAFYFSRKNKSLISYFTSIWNQNAYLREYKIALKGIHDGLNSPNDYHLTYKDTRVLQNIIQSSADYLSFDAIDVTRVANSFLSSSLVNFELFSKTFPYYTCLWQLNDDFFYSKYNFSHIKYRLSRFMPSFNK